MRKGTECSLLCFYLHQGTLILFLFFPSNVSHAILFWNKFSYIFQLNLKAFGTQQTTYYFYCGSCLFNVCYKNKNRQLPFEYIWLFIYCLFLVFHQPNNNSKLLTICEQGIIDINRNGNSANIFSYVCNGKRLPQLFASNLDRIPISVRCVSSMIVVLNAKFALLLAQIKKYGEKRRSPTTVPCFVETHWRLTFIAVFTAHAKKRV